MSVSEPLPEFPYHPDPVATGFVERSSTVCASCGRERGFIYTGPVYAVEQLLACLCPWCIADGSAAARFGAHFTDGRPLPEACRKRVRLDPGADRGAPARAGQGWIAERLPVRCRHCGAHLAYSDID